MAQEVSSSTRVVLTLVARPHREEKRFCEKRDSSGPQAKQDEKEEARAKRLGGAFCPQVVRLFVLCGLRRPRYGSGVRT